MNVKDEIDGIGEHTRAYREETVILPTIKLCWCIICKKITYISEVTLL
jgi:hypothetical protein